MENYIEKLSKKLYNHNAKSARERWVLKKDAGLPRSFLTDESEKVNKIDGYLQAGTVIPGRGRPPAALTGKEPGKVCDRRELL